MPERDMWQEALRLAVDDALIGPALSGNRRIFLSECWQARAFLTTASDDLSFVCAHAGMDPRAVLETMRKRIAQAPTPDELYDRPRQRRDAAMKVPAKPKAIPFPDRPYTIHGTTRTAAEWCDRTGINLNTARGRLSAAWTPERAFTLTRADALRERRAETAASIRAMR